jgi:hypothetical protein
MAVAYVVMETSFEYNDEIYHMGESPGGNPVKVFRKRDMAEKEAMEKSKNFFINGIPLGSLAYDEGDVLVTEWGRLFLEFEGEDSIKTSEVMEEGLPDIFESEEAGRDFIEKMTDAQFEFFLRRCYCGPEPFSVVEVDLDG